VQLFCLKGVAAALPRTRPEKPALTGGFFHEGLALLKSSWPTAAGRDVATGANGANDLRVLARAIPGSLLLDPHLQIMRQSELHRHPIDFVFAIHLCKAFRIRKWSLPIVILPCHHGCQAKLWHGATIMKKTTADAIAKVAEAIARPAATNRGSDKFILRLPDGMRELLAEVAERERRSMNAVALDALALYFAGANTSPGLRRSTEIETAVKEAVAAANRELLDKITTHLADHRPYKELRDQVTNQYQSLKKLLGKK
jgi:hypothetical protein